MNEWISVRDKLPDKDGWYTVTLKRVINGENRFSVEHDVSYGSWREPGTRWYDPEWGIDFDNPDDGIVTHWMDMEPAKDETI